MKKHIGIKRLGKQAFEAAIKRLMDAELALSAAYAVKDEANDALDSLEQDVKGFDAVGRRVPKGLNKKINAAKKAVDGAAQAVKTARAKLALEKTKASSAVLKRVYG